MIPDKQIITEYRNRIGAGLVQGEAGLPLLQRLHERHLLSIPFENLDIHWRVPIRLELPQILDKLIRRRRGGFCYELNGAFHFLLNGLGFSASMHSAQVYENGAFGPPRDHMALLVKLGGGRRWLCDVGFGEFSRFGLEFLPGLMQNPDGGPAYRIDIQEEGHYLLQKQQEGGAFQPVYLFSTEEQELQQFEEMCHYHQTSPQSHFTQGKICTIATPEGRKTLAGGKFVVASREGRASETFSDEARFLDLLEKEFGIRR